MKKTEAIKIHKAMRSVGIIKAIYHDCKRSQYRYTYINDYKFKLDDIHPSHLEPLEETVYAYNLPHANSNERNLEIIKKWMKGARQVDLAREYGVSATTIHQAINRFRNRAPRSEKWHNYYLIQGLDYTKIKDRP